MAGEIPPHTRWTMDKLDSFAINAMIDRMLYRKENMSVIASYMVDYCAKSGIAIGYEAMRSRVKRAYRRIRQKEMADGM